MPENIVTNGNPTTLNNNYNVITEELVRDGLQNDKGKDAELLSWEIKDFTNKGDGYTSIVTSVLITYRKDGTESAFSYVVKLNPERPPSPMIDMMNGIFTRERIILTEVIEPMNGYLERMSLSPIRTPKLFASIVVEGREAFVLENLRTQGFLLHDKRKGQDFHHALFVMEELGRFHASSLLLKESIAPKTFQETYEYFEEPWLDINHESFNVFGNMISSQAEVSIKYLSSFPKYEKCVKWLNANRQNLGRYFVEGFQPSKNFEVLNHGDCHTNNMLFKYNSMNIPVDMRFVDLQCTRLASPASDINYFAYSSLTGETRTKHFQKLLFTYYQSFSKVLIFSRRKVPFTFKELEDEVENRKILGLVVGMLVIPFLLPENEEDIIDFTEMTEDTMDEFYEKQKKTFEKLSENEEGPFKTRFLALFDEMLESHIFDDN